MRYEIMLDLETLGKSPRGAIVAIGAVKMDMDVFEGGVRLEDMRGAFIADSFYTAVSAESSQRWGMDVEGDTVMWWMKQSDQARKRLCEGGRDLHRALDRFSTWVGNAATPVWGNGADFDCVILRSAYRLVDGTIPILRGSIPVPTIPADKMSRCFRTLKNLFPDEELKPPVNAAAHDALEDAKWQAAYLFNIFARMKGLM